MRLYNYFFPFIENKRASPNSPTQGSPTHKQSVLRWRSAAACIIPPPRRRASPSTKTNMLCLLLPPVHMALPIKLKTNKNPMWPAYSSQTLRKRLNGGGAAHSRSCVLLSKKKRKHRICVFSFQRQRPCCPAADRHIGAYFAHPTFRHRQVKHNSQYLANTPPDCFGAQAHPL